MCICYTYVWIISLYRYWLEGHGIFMGAQFGTTLSAHKLYKYSNKIFACICLCLRVCVCHSCCHRQQWWLQHIGSDDWGTTLSAYKLHKCSNKAAILASKCHKYELRPQFTSTSEMLQRCPAKCNSDSKTFLLSRKSVKVRQNLMNQKTFTILYWHFL